MKNVKIDKHWLQVQAAGFQTVMSDKRSPQRVIQSRLESLFKQNEIPPEVIGLCQLYACFWLDGLTTSVEHFATKTIDAEQLRSHTDYHTKLAADMFINAAKGGE